MSVLVITKFAGDVAVFEQSLIDRADEYVQFAEQSRALGAIHHRFGAGAGFVLVIDEWSSVEDYEKFMSNPQLQAFIGEVGADLSGPPEVTVTAAVSSPDEY